MAEHPFESIATYVPAFPFYEAEPFWLKRTYGSGGSSGSSDDEGSSGTKLGRLVKIYSSTSVENTPVEGISGTYVMIDGRSLSSGIVEQTRAGLTLFYEDGTSGSYDVYAVQEGNIASARRIDGGSLPINYVIPEPPEDVSLLFASTVFGPQ